VRHKEGLLFGKSHYYNFSDKEMNMMGGNSTFHRPIGATLLSPVGVITSPPTGERLGDLRSPEPYR
jgi:hypothetical protein